MPNTAASESQGRPTGVVEKVRLRTLFKRRGKLIWALLWFVPVTAMLTGLAMLQRDFQAQRSARNQANILATAFQAEYQQHKSLPAQMPQLAPPDAAIADRYFFNFFYSNSLGAAGRVGVCCMRSSLRLFLAPDGRFVIVYNGQSFAAEWLTELEFQKQAKSLGFPAIDSQ